MRAVGVKVKKDSVARDEQQAGATDVDESLHINRCAGQRRAPTRARCLTTRLAEWACSPRRRQPGGHGIAAKSARPVHRTGQQGNFSQPRSSALDTYFTLPFGERIGIVFESLLEIVNFVAVEPSHLGLRELRDVVKVVARVKHLAFRLVVNIGASVAVPRHGDQNRTDGAGPANSKGAGAGKPDAVKAERACLGTIPCDALPRLSLSSAGAAPSVHGDKLGPLTSAISATDKLMSSEWVRPLRFAFSCAV